MKILTIYAHPADTITNCGGTLARHAARGDAVVALILTHGGRIHPNKYAEEWRKDRPDVVICDYPMNPTAFNPHTTASVLALVPPRTRHVKYGT